MGIYLGPVADKLSAGINNAVTALAVYSGLLFPAAPFQIKIDSEYLYVTSKGARGTAWTVQRGYAGTAAASHSKDAPVTQNWDTAHSSMFSGGLSDLTAIWVSKVGSDLMGDGSFAHPVASLTKAFALATASRLTIFMLPGEYAEAAMVDWPDISGLSVIGLGPVSISNVGAGAAVIDIAPTYTASTMSITLKDLTIAADTQIGLQVDNAHMSKKLNIHLDGVSFEGDTSGDSISVTNTITTQAIRIYARDCSIEMLTHIESLNAGCRARCTNCDFIGGITTTGAVAAEVSLIGCVILTNSITIATEQTLCTVGCVYRTDTDPAIYSNCANAFEA